MRCVCSNWLKYVPTETAYLQAAARLLAYKSVDLVLLNSETIAVLQWYPCLSNSDACHTAIWDHTRCRPVSVPKTGDRSLASASVAVLRGGRRWCRRLTSHSLGPDALSSDQYEPVNVSVFQPRGSSYPCLGSDLYRYRSQWRRHGGGGKRGNFLPPPQPPIGHPVRSMQIRGDFRVRKDGGRFIGFAPTFYMHRRYGGRSLVLRLRKKGVVEVWCHSSLMPFSSKS